MTRNTRGPQSHQSKLEQEVRGFGEESLKEENGLHSTNNVIKKLGDFNDLILKGTCFFSKEEKRKAMRNSKRTKSSLRKSWPK